MKFETTNTIEANTPYLIKPKVFKTSYCINGVNVSPSDNPQTDIAGVVTFKGNYTCGKSIADDSYYIKDNLFYQSTGNVKIKAYRGFFQSYSTTTKQLSIYDPDATAIILPNNDADSNLETYDLQGRKVYNAESLPNGIYIKNGRKLIVR